MSYNTRGAGMRPSGKSSRVISYLLHSVSTEVFERIDQSALENLILWDSKQRASVERRF